MLNTKHLKSVRFFNARQSISLIDIELHRKKKLKERSYKSIMTIAKTASVKQLTSYNIIINHPEAPIERYLVDGFSFDVVYLVKQAIKIAF